MYDVIETAVKSLINSSEISGESSDALRFSQAALNLAHTLAVMEDTRRGDNA